MIAPTLHEIFEEWKKNGDARTTWTLHWEHIWSEHIATYLSLGWHLMPIAPRSKKPLDHYKWDVAKPLDQVRALDFMRAGCNIAVVAGPSRLVILDFDSEIAPELHDMAHLTMTARTPRGYQFYTGADISLGGQLYARYVSRLKRRFPNMDSPRVNVMYALVPPSQSDRNNEEGEKTDYRVRLWIPGAPEKPIAFSRFVRIAT